MDGWIMYGEALNEGREMFPGDREFGQWMDRQLGGVHDHDRAAAMWAAGNPEQFRETKKANPRVRINPCFYAVEQYGPQLEGKWSTGFVRENV